MPKLIWSDASIRDLRDINDHIGRLDGTAAARILRAIKSSASLLTEYPGAGPSRGGQDFRYLSVRRTAYILAYQIGVGRIEILRVYHASQNWRGEDQ